MAFFRFIPASAGNTPAAMSARMPATVHPRERGEHHRRGRRRRIRCGSSPRARGTHGAQGVGFAAVRFIPASAGNTPSANGCVSPPAVHPRERGEHQRKNGGIRCATGSSPRARGTRHRHRSALWAVRFIPASAGNTARVGMTARQSPVHPRERGEHPTPKPASWPAAGSSPRARGTRPRDQRPALARRFIPASAGNTRPPHGN